MVGSHLKTKGNKIILNRLKKKKQQKKNRKIFQKINSNLKSL